MKLLVLAIASHSPVYEYFINVFKAYMNSRPWIKSYLLFGNSSTFRVTEDEIHMPVHESLIPGILHKTIWSMKWALENLEFDYMLRTNLSTFWMLDRLENLLNTLPKENVCWSHRDAVGHFYPDDPGYLTGCGMLYSRDILEKLSDIKNWNYHWPDDTEFSKKAIAICNPQLLHTSFYHWKCDSPKEINLKEHLDNIDKGDYIHIRVKNPFYQGVQYNEVDRLIIDHIIHTALYYRYACPMPVLSLKETSLVRYCMMFNVKVESKISDQLKHFIENNPHQKENIQTITISDTFDDNSIYFKDGEMIIVMSHPMIHAIREMYNLNDCVSSHRF